MAVIEHIRRCRAAPRIQEVPSRCPILADRRHQIGTLAGRLVEQQRSLHPVRGRLKRLQSIPASSGLLIGNRRTAAEREQPRALYVRKRVPGLHQRGRCTRRQILIAERDRIPFGPIAPSTPRDLDARHRICRRVLRQRSEYRDQPRIMPQRLLQASAYVRESSPQSESPVGQPVASHARQFPPPE